MSEPEKLEAVSGTVEDLGDAMDTEVQGESTADAPETVESSEKEAVNLEKMADDYAKYLIVNSKQDVSVSFSCGSFTCPSQPTRHLRSHLTHYLLWYNEWTLPRVCLTLPWQ